MSTEGPSGGSAEQRRAQATEAASTDLTTEQQPSRSLRREDFAPNANAPSYYPDRLMPIAGEHQHLVAESKAQANLSERYEAFSAQRENILLDYGYNTARAYWGDLDDLFWWAEGRGLDIYRVSDREFIQYIGLLRRRKYSENTVRRRRTAFRKWRAQIEAGGN